MNAPPRLLFITLSNIGDLVMTTPVLEALHELFADCLIDIVADARSASLLEACPYRGDIFLKDKQAGWKARWRFVLQLRRRKYRAIVDLRGPLLPFLLRGEARMSKPPYRDETMHAIEHHFSALRKIRPGTHVIPAPKIWIPQQAARTAHHELAAFNAKHCLAIAPGANWPGKIWPADAYVSLIERVSNVFDGVCLFGGPDDRPTAEAITAAIELPAINLCGKTTLIAAAACLAEMQHFVGNDSGLGHMAAALGVPTLTVFGPGQPARYRPWGEHASLVYAPQNDLNQVFLF